MNELLGDFARWIAGSPAQDLATSLLRTVPGLPPILQTVHLLAIAVVMGSVVFVNLRMMRLAVPSQNLGEMLGRLMPWTWWALLFLFLSALPFLLARPGRYFTNPVFQIKFSVLLPAVLLAIAVYRLSRRQPDYWELDSQRRLIALILGAVSLMLWLAVAMAGRWIAYSDYLFWPG